MRRQFEIERLNLAAQKRAVRASFFVAGPYIDPRGEEPVDGENLEARIARYRAFRAIVDRFEHDCVLGEHEDLIEIYKEHLGQHNNAAMAEIMHISQSSDGLIIFPSSPGSFSELGYFSTNANVCSKMLIIIDEKYENAQNYINLGPVKSAAFYGAEVKYSAYSDTDEIIKIISEFVDSAVTKKIAKEFMT